MTKPPLDKTPPDDIPHPPFSLKIEHCLDHGLTQTWQFWTMSGMCLDNVWTLFGLCLVYVWTVPMQCHDIISTKSTLSLDNLWTMC